MHDFSLEARLREAVSDIAWIQELIFLKETGSTNNYLKQAAMSHNYPEGVLVFAEKQLKGRGRFGRSWDSPAGLGIWCSILFIPEKPISDLEWLHLGATACMKVITKDFDLPVTFKHPNDLLVKQRKLCGILTETVRKGDVIKRVVMGIGLNVNQEPDDFDVSVRNTAVSLKMLCGHDIDRIGLFRRILIQLTEDYTSLSQLPAAEQVLSH